MLIDEILPEVGKRYALTTDPERRALAGASSGGICAFTAAWERPDYFRKVVSHIGSFTNIRGGYAYPFLIRKARHEAAPRVPAGRLERSRQPVRQLAARQPVDGRGAEVQEATTIGSSSAMAPTRTSTVAPSCPIPCAGCGATSAEALASLTPFPEHST